MRKNVTLARESTLEATILGGIRFGIISPFLSLVFTAGDGLGAMAVGVYAIMLIGSLLSATIAFGKVTIKYMTFTQAVGATIAYGVALALMGIAVVNGVPALLIFIATNIPENWSDAVSVFYLIVLVVLVALPSIIATCWAKLIYPRSDLPLEAKA